MIISENHFKDMMTDLFCEYFPKTKTVDRKAFTEALMDELRALDVEFEEEVAEEAEDSYFEDVDE